MGELEEFLRRLAQQAASALEEDEEIIDAEIVETVKPSATDITVGESVAGHVAHHLDPTTMAQRGARLGRQIDTADERMDARLRGVFEHRLGDLGAPTGKPAESTLDDDRAQAAAPRRGSEIVAILRSPRTLRHMVILREIIDRPVHRW
jgi:hypothetical protein